MIADLETIISDALGIPLESVDDSLEYRSVPEWDSVAHLRLILALEDALELSIDDQLVVELTSVAAIREFAFSSATS